MSDCPLCSKPNGFHGVVCPNRTTSRMSATAACLCVCHDASGDDCSAAHDFECCSLVGGAVLVDPRGLPPDLPEALALAESALGTSDEPTWAGLPESVSAVTRGGITVTRDAQRAPLCICGVTIFDSTHECDEAFYNRDRSPRHLRFVLQRDVDATGISGTGIVAEGVAFSDGVVALRWIVPAGNPGHGFPTSVVFHDNGVESVEQIHGHGGATQIVWLD